MVRVAGYTFAAGGMAGGVLAWIAGSLRRASLIATITLQETALVGALLSPEMAATAPVAVWIGLLVIIPISLVFGYLAFRKLRPHAA